VARRQGPARGRTGPGATAAAPSDGGAPVVGVVGAAADSAAAGEEPLETSEGHGCAEVEESDAVTPALTYNAAVGARATPPKANQFGVTTTKVNIKNVNAVAAGGAFQVSGAVDVSARWSVHSRGRTDVPYFAAPAVTATTYLQVAKDLKPNMSSDGGRPPRKQYWAKDLTERHERFHADERTGKYGKAAFEFAKSWLAAQTASTAEEAKDHADEVPGKMFESYNASFVPGKENRAYGDGAIAYRVRSDMAREYGESLKKGDGR